MADRAAGVAVVRCVVDADVVERGHQHAGGEVDVVHRRVVIGIHRRWRHEPFAPVDGFADPGQLSLRLEDGRPRDVAVEVAALDIERGVVAPNVRKADLVTYLVQFVERLLLGFVAHPVEILDARLHCRDDEVGHRYGVDLVLAAGTRGRRTPCRVPRPGRDRPSPRTSSSAAAAPSRPARWRGKRRSVRRRTAAKGNRPGC